MLTFKQGNIFDSDAESLVNPTNCVGVMGKGLALQFKKRFPDYFRAYSKACLKQRIHPGEVVLFPLPIGSRLHYIISFPTKRHWREDSELSYIEVGLADLVESIQNFGIQSVAIPALGCGEGGLKWSDVKPLIEAALTPLADVYIEVYEPIGAGE